MITLLFLILNFVLSIVVSVIGLLIRIVFYLSPIGILYGLLRPRHHLHHRMHHYYRMF